MASHLGKRPIKVEDSGGNKFRKIEKRLNNDFKRDIFGSEKTIENEDNFFEIFKSYPLVLDQSIQIDHKVWAKAFMERDVKDISSILSRAIFTPEDFENRNKFGICGLPMSKRNAVLKASNWMLNKSQDPWSYNPEIVELPNNCNEIETVFQEIENVDPYLNLTFGDLLERPEIITKSNQSLSTTNSNAQVVQISELSVENTIKHFRDFVQWYILINPKTICVDGLKFTFNRWALGFLQMGIVSTAEVLFRKYWIRKFISKFENSVEDLCPITRLAILRASAWIDTIGKHGGVDSFDYDTEIPHHNVYPSVQEVHKIETQVFKKYIDLGLWSKRIGIPVETVLIFCIQNAALAIQKRIKANLNKRWNSNSMIKGKNNRVTASSSNSDWGDWYSKIESDYLLINTLNYSRTEWLEKIRDFDNEEIDIEFQTERHFFENCFDQDDMKFEIMGEISSPDQPFRVRTDGASDCLDILKPVNRLGKLLNSQNSSEQTAEEIKLSWTRRIFDEYEKYLWRRKAKNCISNSA